MCGPAAVVLPIAAAAMTAASQGMGAIMASNQGKYEAKIAEQNAAIEREGLVLEQEATQTDALNHYRRVAELKGQQRMAAAGGNVSTDFGTAADIVDDTEMLSREDIDRLYRGSNERMKGIDRSVANFKGEASAKRSAAKGALIKGLFDVGSTVLGAAQQVKAAKANLPAKTSSAKTNFGGTRFSTGGSMYGGPRR